ncbi:hypothetical protein HanIR_Chr13g0640911 [Helianthus annuus]|nr:hypothetical protein HanIR_Chr13g0640911 [Helianthus annuus]
MYINLCGETCYMFILVFIQGSYFPKIRNWCKFVIPPNRWLIRSYVVGPLLLVLILSGK